jgi:serine palmitoyltransferase
MRLSSVVPARHNLDSCRSTTGVARHALNLGSYNYLGFADDWHVTCKTDVMQTLHNFPTSCSSARMDWGTLVLHRELESTVARFLGKEDALVYTMGFGTNSTTIPALVGKGSLLISDSLNHMSIINGARASSAHVRVFKHNNPQNLEEILREAISLGQPRTHRPWKKIIVLVEGMLTPLGIVHCTYAHYQESIRWRARSVILRRL